MSTPSTDRAQALHDWITRLEDENERLDDGLKFLRKMLEDDKNYDTVTYLELIDTIRQEGKLA